MQIRMRRIENSLGINPETEGPNGYTRIPFYVAGESVKEGSQALSVF